MRVAVYPGSFDPPTYGHQDIIQRSAAMFDKVYLTVFTNPDKQHGLFSAAERVEMLREMVHSMPNVVVDSYYGLLVDYCRNKDASVIIRGLRAVSDFDYEFGMALMNKNLDPSIETVFMMTNPDFLFLSSSKVKELASFGADIGGLVPPCVEARLRNKYSPR